MRFTINKHIAKLVYKDYSLGKSEEIILTDGKILNVTSLIPPMRDKNNTNLTKREPHITFYSGKKPYFIPTRDVISIQYGN